MLRSSSAVILACLLCCACAAPYDRYMQEGRKFHSEKETAKARRSFHDAVLVARGDQKGKERLIDALLAEKECAVELAQSQDALKLLSEVTEILEKKGEYKRAAVYRKDMGYLANTDPPAALQYFETGLADLKKAGFEISPEAAAIFAGIGELKSGQNDFEAAAVYLEKACALLARIKYNENDHAHATYLHKLAWVYEQLNRENDAIEANEKAKALEMSSIRYAVDRQPRL